MLMPTKIQPIGGEEEVVVPAVKPVVKSRLKRLFRIPIPPSTASTTATAASEFEPSSVCLAKMVTNFIEENNNGNERHGSRNRCNCFNGNGSDGSDGEADAADVGDFLKSLVVCATVNERNVVADTARLVAEKSSNQKSIKRKDELRKIVVEGLFKVGYDAAICKSKWEKSSSFPAGEYEYVDVIVGGERLIIDIDFRSEFEVARSTKTYKSILQTLPNIFVGKADRLSKIVCIISEAAKQSLKKKGMHVPPWRKSDYVQAKWLSPPTRLVVPPTPAAPADVVPPTPAVADVVPTTSSIIPGPAQTDSVLVLVSNIDKAGPGRVPGPVVADILAETDRSDESTTSSSSTSSETVFDMSEISGEEDVKEEEEQHEQHVKSKRGFKIVTGLASLMEGNKS